MKLRPWIQLALLIVGVALLVWLFFGAIPVAAAHDGGEIQQWEREWVEKVRVRGVLTITLLEERSDFMDRHGWHYFPQEAPVTTSSSSSSSSGGGSVSRGMGSNVEQWRGLVAAYFPASEVNRALCIMAHESGGNPGAKNPRSSARGLFQVLGSLWAPHYGVSQEALYDPTTNVSIASKIWSQSGWWAWSPYKRGACR